MVDFAAVCLHQLATKGLANKIKIWWLCSVNLERNGATSTSWTHRTRRIHSPREVSLMSYKHIFPNSWTRKHRQMTNTNQATERNRGKARNTAQQVSWRQQPCHLHHLRAFWWAAWSQQSGPNSPRWQR